MLLPPSLHSAIAASRAIVRVGYPWWLRPWLARDVVAITLGRRIYLSGAVVERPESLERLLRHELAHVRQVRRHGLIVFLALYVTEFLRHFWRERSVRKAYSRISFEIEARDAEGTGPFDSAQGRPIIPRDASPSL
jgi:hypothetical protein